jgi:hypothetical protein
MTVQGKMVEVGPKLVQEQAAREELLSEQGHLQLAIGRLKNPRRPVKVARSRPGMTPQPGAIKRLQPASTVRRAKLIERDRP